jgi:glycosyltransferase involved in cell wall biosynthesis
MKILLSAFACVPFAGSEGGVGWRYAVELGKSHQVVVLTDVSRRAAIQNAMVDMSLPGVQFVYYRPWFLKQVPLNSLTAKLMFTAWQFSVLPFARYLHGQHQFDVAWHLTYGLYRTPSFLGYMGVPLVFGPAGGGEDAPLRLKKSITGVEKLKELVRSVANWYALINPFLWISLRRADLLLVKTAQTKMALPWPYRSKAIAIQEIGIDDRGLSASDLICREPGRPLEVLYAGNLLGLKGVHLAIRAISMARERGIDLRFTIVGSGRIEFQLRALATRLGVQDITKWISRVPQHELFEIYKQSHVFLFPSLHDSSGNVVLEAQSFGLPVVCLDLGGPPTLVDETSAIVVTTSSRSEEDVVVALADALVALSVDESKRKSMASCALMKSASQTWSGRINQIAGMVETIVKTK